MLKAGGWHTTGGQHGLKKAVMVAAPHTSNWDFVWAMAALHSMQINVKYLAKKELFKPPLGWLMKALGGVPVDRGKNNNLVEAMAEKIISSPGEMIVLFPPEGSRSAVNQWKTGFYHTARLAGVPILLAYLDYEKKEAAVSKVFYPTGDIEKDMQAIQAFYNPIVPRHPEKFTGNRG